MRGGEAGNLHLWPEGLQSYIQLPAKCCSEDIQQGFCGWSHTGGFQSGVYHFATSVRRLH